MSKFKGKQAARNGADISRPRPPTKCLACNGSGHYDIKNSPKCSACNGTGKEKP